jgi:anti-sigma-K factor RskA
MATTSVGNQPFARIVETGKTSSWSIGIPIALAVVVVAALLAYFAARASQANDQLAAGRRDAEQQQQQVAQMQQRLGQLDAELNRLRSPGRTTVILQAASAPKRGQKAAAAWGAATWGEQGDGKTWVRLNAYGLQEPGSGKTYALWFQAASGDAMPAGKLELDGEGNAHLEAKDLPGVDQGKQLVVSLDDENAKTAGQTLISAQLPKLTPGQHAPQQAAQQPQQQPSEPQKPGPQPK